MPTQTGDSRRNLCRRSCKTYRSSVKAFIITEKVWNIFVKFSDINIYEYPFSTSEVLCTPTDWRKSALFSWSLCKDMNSAWKWSSCFTSNTQDSQIQGQAQRGDNLQSRSACFFLTSWKVVPRSREISCVAVKRVYRRKIKPLKLPSSAQTRRGWSTS